MRTLGGNLVMEAKLMGRVDAPFSLPLPPLCVCVYVCMHMHMEARSKVPMLFFRC